MGEQSNNAYALRLLGTCDGFAHAIVAIRRVIETINYRPIDKRHVRLLAERSRVLEPLRELQGSLELKRNSAMKAYEEHRKTGALP